MCALEITSSVQYLLDAVNNDHLEVDKLIDTFRFLRNKCSESSTVQNSITAFDGLISAMKRILLEVLTGESESLQLCAVVGFQFIANLIVQNSENQLKVWSDLHNVIKSGLLIENNKIQNCCAMILYNIYIGHPEIIKNLSDNHIELLNLTLNEKTSEFAIYIFEFVILKSNYVEMFYTKLDIDKKIILLEILEGLATKEDAKDKIDEQTVKYLVDIFTKTSDRILQTVCRQNEDLKPTEVVLLLKLLVVFSSDNADVYLSILQKCKSLLINCIYLLKSIHDISKEAGNNFTMINKLSELEEIDDSKIENHPAYGFKCSLIRLIGNMCWEHSDNQNTVRELDCISLLLDCCNIDGRNPFILQWAIFSIRNICYKNIANQKVIAGLSSQGVVDVNHLKELGITLNSEDQGSSVCLGPLLKK